VPHRHAPSGTAGSWSADLQVKIFTAQLLWLIAATATLKSYKILTAWGSLHRAQVEIWSVMTPYLGSTVGEPLCAPLLSFARSASRVLLPKVENLYVLRRPRSHKFFGGGIRTPKIFCGHMVNFFHNSYFAKPISLKTPISVQPCRGTMSLLAS